MLMNMMEGDDGVRGFNKESRKRYSNIRDNVMLVLSFHLSFRLSFSSSFGVKCQFSELRDRRDE